jgi:signal transduction histidine kinase/ActR/RegA family two-component response regulator
VISQIDATLQMNPVALLFVLAAALSVWLVVLAWRRRAEPAAPPLIAVLAFEGVWALCEGIEAILVDPTLQFALYGLKIASVSLVAPTMLIFVLEYTGRREVAPLWFKVMVYLMPAVSISLVATASSHTLFLDGMDPIEVQGFRLLRPRYGPGFWMNACYSYALLGLSAVLLARTAVRLRGILRSQILLLFICLLIPFVINVLDLLRLIPEPYREYDLTAAVFVVTGVLGVLALERYHLINVAPVSYALVVQEMLDAVIVLDDEKRIAGVNRAALRLIDRREREVLGQPGSIIPGWLRLVEHLAKPEEAERAYQVEGDTPFVGLTYDVRVSRFPQGRRPGWLVIIRDISAWIRAEAERTARIAAEEANHAKDAFLAKLSHELRTPLTPVLAAISAALDHNLIPAELRASLDTAQRNIHLEAKLIDDLLDQSLITLGKFRLQRAIVDVHQVVRRSLENCAAFVDDAGLVVQLDLSAPRSRVSADANRLQQVCWNLIINAAKYSPAGSRLTIRSRNLTEDEVAIEFQDEGRGIEASRLPRIFEPFMRGSSGGEGHGPGLGLGLTISRSIVEAHGGTLVARSPGPGKGATFQVNLRTVAPTEDAPFEEPGDHGVEPHVPAASPSESESDTAPHRHLTILLVEDNPDSLRALALSLSLLGHTVRTANSLRSALAAARSTDHDLIISDLELGDGTGLDLLRELGPRRSAPAIALTGYGSEDDREMSRDAGFMMHIVKPIATKQLHEAIQRVFAEQPT